jgi:phosphomannomutase
MGALWVWLTRRSSSRFVQVGGSDLVKQQEQLGTPSIPVTSLFDFCFPENGLTAYRLGEPLASSSFIQWLGEDKYQTLVDFCLRYISNVKLPRKRGTFVEFRNGMINVSPVGRNASVEERNEFERLVSVPFLGNYCRTH